MALNELLAAEWQMSMNLPESTPLSGIPLRATAWMLRTLVIAVIGLLCVIADSFNPAFAFALALVPSIVCVAAFMTGGLQFPRFLSTVHSFEPVLYRSVGVGVVKRIVATRIWPVLVGVIPPPKPAERIDFLKYIEHSTEGAEICHWPALVLAFSIAILCMVVGRNALALWILVFNIILNAYPIMVQRSNRWRVHRIRANAEPNRAA